VHMVTAADGAADFYTLSTNSARSEDMKEAVHRDGITRSVSGLFSRVSQVSVKTNLSRFAGMARLSLLRCSR
jgi:hypothetical protein